MTLLTSPHEDTALPPSPMGAIGLRHLAVIMDGNRRWASKRGLPSLAGHTQGVQSLKRLVTHASDQGLEVLTVYAFSTENWQRSLEEVGWLLNLLTSALGRELGAMEAAGVQLSFIGDLEPFPEPLRRVMADATARTKNNTGLRLQVATNYGSRAEIVRAVQKLARQVADGQLPPEAITEALITESLDTAGQPDPDLLIRTGGESRLSNYLLWQCAYTELWVTPTLWPDFGPAEFDQAAAAFAQRQRRYGR